MAIRRRTPTPPPLDLSEIGVSGLTRYSGYIYEEPLLELKGVRWRQVIKEMTYNDPVVGGMLFAIEMLARRVQWNTVPADDSAEAVDFAVFVETCRHDMSITWSDQVAEIFSMLPWGWSFFETVYKHRQGQPDDTEDPPSKHDDGRVGWRKWAIRSQDTLLKWDFDENGGLQTLIQQAPPDWQLRHIPIQKGLLFRPTSWKNNPEGRSVLRNAYVPWFYKTKIQRIEAIGIERDLAGLPIAFVPPELLSSNATTQDAAVLATIKQLIVNIRRDEQEGLIYPLAYTKDGKLAYDLKLLSSGGTRQFDTNAIIDRYDQRIAVSLLADFLLLGTNRVGSFALSNDKTDLFASALTGWLDSVCDVVNRFAIPKLLLLNGMDPALAPRLVHSEIKNVDLIALGNYIAKLVASGAAIFPNPELERYLLEVADLPVPVGVAPSSDVHTPDSTDPSPTKRPTGTPKAPTGTKSKPRVVNVKGQRTPVPPPQEA